MKTRIILSMLILGLIGASCAKEPLTRDAGFVFSETGEPIATKTSDVSWNSFTANVSGFGWQCKNTRRILDDGSLEKGNYWEYRDGGGPSVYYFSQESFTRYFSIPRFVNSRVYQLLSFDYNNGAIIPRYDDGSNERALMRLTKITKDSFYCVELLGYQGVDGKPIYGYSLYKKLSASDLAALREEYSTDYLTLK